MSQKQTALRAPRDGSYLSPIQVSVRTGIPKHTLAGWRRDGRGPQFVKHGGRIVYSSGELEVWLSAKHREKPGSDP